MLVKMLVGLSGPAYTLVPGDEKDFPQDEAIRLIEAGFAAPVAVMKIETAVLPDAPERRRGRPPGAAKKESRDVVSGDGYGSGIRRAG